MPNVDNSFKFGKLSKFRFYFIINDKNNKNRIGLRDNSIIQTIKSLPSYKYAIPAKYEFRPDLISNELFGTPKLWWVLTLANDIKHPLKDFYVDRVIDVPEANSLMAILI